VASYDLGEGALSRAVGSHDGVDLTGIHREIDAAEDLLIASVRSKSFDFQQPAPLV
jgi:hypothetical protein